MQISTGKSRKDTNWKVIDVSWDELVKRLSKPTVTQETMGEYKAMPKDERSERKDVGGFVGGVIRGGNRTARNVVSRTLITLDADFANEDIWDTITLMCDYNVCMYCTHSHQPKAPRYRVIIPLDRPVSPEEYEPIARRVAADIGIDQFDVTTYEASRLMYWPSVPRDCTYVLRVHGEGALSADETLARYKNWHDISEWPTSSTEDTIRVKQTKAQGDPTTKAGMVGLFCRTYDVPAAIDRFLPDVYTRCADANRYTFNAGSTSGGMVLYQNGQFAYSHHATDPAGGVLCSAYDLVRLHKFKDLDGNTDLENTPISKWPSIVAMNKFAAEDEEVKALLYQEKLAEAKDAFSDAAEAATAQPDEPDSVEWAKSLAVKNGAYEITTENIILILENDPNIAGRVALNEFTNRLSVIKDLPWRKVKDTINGDLWTDIDDSALRYYLERTYKIVGPAKINDALNVCMMRNAFHPVRDYLNTLTWDGIKRADGLFIDYMGAEDTAYVRTVTRKWLTAAVARVMRPGCKFDNMIVLIGAQGIGKSFLASKLGRHWFSDTFLTVQGKDAYEQLKGCWIIEMGELAAARRSEVESVKMFISKQEDTYRGAYQRHAQTYKRQCVFYGTTNDDAFLKDRTGNRRFWPIGVSSELAKKNVFKLRDTDIDQIWAEAVEWYKSGETLFLPPEIAKAAIEAQEKYMEVDPKQGLVEEYLDRDLPANWGELGKTDRRNFIQGYIPLKEGEPTIKRNVVSAVEIAYELFGKDTLAAWEAKEITQLLKGIPNWHKTGEMNRTLYGRQYIYRRKEESPLDS